MSTRLVIFGLLREKPLYGYEIKQIIEENMGDWTSIAFGSIYFALDKLAEKQFIEKVAVEQKGSRPSRSVYQITAEGRKEFLHLLRSAWNETERQYFSVDIALAFMEALPVKEVIGYLTQRISELEKTLMYLNSHQAEQMTIPHVPRTAEVVFNHSRFHYEAELAWTRDLLKRVENGEYS
jgi:DNA-binding PadR family transcriptional regulator